MGSYHPFLKAIPYTIILCAITHLFLSLFYGLLHSDLNSINMFHVLGFDLFWPKLGKGAFNAFLGALVVAIAGITVALTLQWRDKRADHMREMAKKTKHRSKEK